MRKILLFLGFTVLISVSLHSQNVQLHYDFGKILYDELDTRPPILSTVEFYHPDKWGSTYFFVDMVYSSDGMEGAYWEIYRDLRFWELPLNIHFEYHGGNKALDRVNYLAFNNAYFVGLSYQLDNSSGLYGFEFIATYYYFQKYFAPHNFKFTFSWYWHFAKELCTFNGYAEWWREVNEYSNCMFLAEPQVWFNFNKLKFVDDQFKLSIGSEVKVSYNYVGKGLYVIPTAAIKWSF
ncbi:DUF5020 family protein [Bacteroidales bacterium OttesenSCG-928-K22]|nr:DUF5020 family protein [Bacteroidales bacterium OttesenSCG-928-L14]MDL2241140.1 DUF5020 family protein [Bacteroidales bacterium OttesenSCG-928-K22]